MPLAVSMAKRHQVIKLFDSGKPMSEISVSLGLSYGTVRQLCKNYEAHGLAGLAPKYENCGSSAPKYEALIYRAVRCLRTWHEGWGAGRIQALLAQKYPGKALPSTRTIQRWFRRNGQIKLKSKQPKEGRQRAKKVHQVRQIDAKEELKLANGQQACWLNIEDEFSSAVLDPPVFPLRENLASTGLTSTTSND